MTRSGEEVTPPMQHTAQVRGVVAVVGLGKIGLPLALQYIQHGYRVWGCDTNERVVKGINAGHCHVLEEPGLPAMVAEAVRAGMLSATMDTTAATREADVVVVIVPVLVRDGGSVDFASIDAATTAVGRGLTPGTLVIYETTLPVGTTAHRFRASLERESGLSADGDFALAFSPERVSSGVIFRDLRLYPKVVGGVDAASTARAVAFYSSVLEAPVIEMASADDAEFVKLIETTYRDVNIALANEFARFADTRGLDALAAFAAANTQPYAHIHQPGVGVGGHCIPVYPYFLLHGLAEGSAEEAHELSLPRRARVINDGMAAYAVARLEAAVGSLDGQCVALLGVAYRGNVKETAFTSARLLRDALQAGGARVVAEDPLYSDEELAQLGYTPLTSDLWPEVVAIIVQAAHSTYRQLDWRAFTGCRALLDGRGALERASVERAGIRYLVIGDGGSEAPSDRTHTGGTQVAAPSSEAPSNLVAAARAGPVASRYLAGPESAAASDLA